MKSKLMLILVAGLLAGPMAVQALPMVYSASLDGLSEVPPNASPGSGNVTVTVDDMAMTMRVEAMFADLIGTTLAAHIHCCAPPGTNASVATAVPTFPGFPVAVMSGAYDMLFDMTLPGSYSPAFVMANGDTIDSAFAALLAGLNAGQAYFNVHTTQFPGGEIRGNLRADVPVPGTLFLVGMGLAGATLLRRRQPA